MGKVVTYNDYASDLLYLGPSNITQTSKEYSERSTYGISFEPFSKIQNENSEALTILLAYPNTVSPVSITGCEVVAAAELGENTSRVKRSKKSDCN